jgi:hypothetical protein
MTDSSLPPERSDASGADAEEAMVRAVKSRILEQLVEALGQDEVRHARASHYTKSDSGLYGKYQKYEDINNQVLEVVRQQLETLLGEFSPDDGPRAAGLLDPAPPDSAPPAREHPVGEHPVGEHPAGEAPP